MHVTTLLCLSLAGCLFTGCGTENTTAKQQQASDEVSMPENSAAVSGSSEKDVSITGFYVGDFEAKKTNEGKNPMRVNRINVSVDSLKDGRIYGHSVVAGNIRSFAGTYVMKEGQYEAEAKEPGNDQYDGVFMFTLDPQSQVVKGKWFANNKQLAVTERSYTLNKRNYSYDASLELGDIEVDVLNVSERDADYHEHITSDAGKINASTTLLKKSDVENMYKRDLEVMRNAIYARHGYSFKNREMRDFFDKNVSWYIPVSTDVTKELTELEKTNIDLLKRYEKHAATYYDDFGR